LACQDESFVNNLLYVEQNDEHALDLTLRLPRNFRFGCLDMPFKQPYTAHAFFLERVSHHCQDLHQELLLVRWKFQVKIFHEDARFATLSQMNPVLVLARHLFPQNSCIFKRYNEPMLNSLDFEPETFATVGWILTPGQAVPTSGDNGLPLVDRLHFAPPPTAVGSQLLSSRRLAGL
jgi:hypothetical protein